jgi:hypothetical protein
MPRFIENLLVIFSSMDCGCHGIRCLGLPITPAAAGFRRGDRWLGGPRLQWCAPHNEPPAAPAIFMARPVHRPFIYKIRFQI